MQIGGVPTSEVNALEMELLGLLEYRMFVPRHELWLQLQAIRMITPATQLAARVSASQCKPAAKQEDKAAVEQLAACQRPQEEGLLVSAVPG